MQKPRVQAGHGARFARTCSGPNSCPSVAALQRPTFVFAQASPNAMVLTRFERPCKALFTDVAAAAHDFRFFDLKDGGTSIADGEEELWVFIKTCCTVSPIHEDAPSHFLELPTVHQCFGSAGLQVLCFQE